MSSDTWLKLHTSLLTSAKFVGLPSNDHRLAFVCLLLLAKKGLESAPERYTLAHVFLGKKRWKTVRKDLIESGLLNDDGKVNGFEDSQLSASAWKMRRLRERNKARDGSGHSDGHSDRECRMQSVSSPTEKKNPPTPRKRGPMAFPFSFASDAGLVVDHLVAVTGRDFDRTVALDQIVRALRDDKATVEDCRRVIDYLWATWSDEWRPRINKVTPFRKANFLRYLDEAKAGPTKSGGRPITSTSIDEGGWEY